MPHLRAGRALLVGNLLFTLAPIACRETDRTAESRVAVEAGAAGESSDAGERLVEALHSRAVLPEGLPFSEAVRVGSTLYLSGQIGIVPGSLALVEGGLPAEARQTMDNIRATLGAHGYTMRDVVKCTVMLTDISRWGEFNDIYVTYFSAPYPARSAVGASGLALGAEVEVECIAARDSGG